ncbi:MAG: hypothetical protein ACI9WU_002739 [Myxococcota bacterium]
MITRNGPTPANAFQCVVNIEIAAWEEGVSRVEQYELIRRDHFVHKRSIRWIAKRHRVHRREVRQALSASIPPPRKAPERTPPVLTFEMRGVIDGWLKADREAPRKQRHTARRIYQRIQREHGYAGAESTVRRYVGQRRRELGLRLQAFVPLTHLAGEEAEVDWYEAVVDFPHGREKVQVLEVRACFSGREFHIAYPRQTQQASLEAIGAAFTYFGGVFAVMRFDNLSSAVKKVLKGRRRIETDQFVAFRSHYLFESEFCRPGLQGAHEKGGVEGGVGRFRRNHLVPVPQVSDFQELNRQLLDHCATDDHRIIEGRGRSILKDWDVEQPLLRALPGEPFPAAQVETPRVDSRARIRVRTNHYSVPVRFVGQRVEVRLHATYVEAVAAGTVVARHERLHGRHGERLELDHYLELLRLKPGALARSRPLSTARQTGLWPADYDALWAALKQRHGDSEGTREMVDVALLHRQADPALVGRAVALALEYGTVAASVVQMLVCQLALADAPVEPLRALGALERYERPASSDLTEYDQLLSSHGGWGLA